MAAVNITGVHKWFGSTHVIHGVDIAIADGEFCVLVGPSGCGKSTLLRMIAGLEEITDGEIAIGGKVVNRVQPKERDIAMVFQNYALYPHMTVRDNMSFALKLAKRGSADIEQRVARAAGILGSHRISTGIRASSPAASAARRHGTRDRARPAGVPVRRAAVEPRCQAPRPDAHRDQGAAPAPEDDVDLRDARPDRGHDDGRSDRRDARRHRRAGRRSAAALRHTGEHVRRRVHRVAGDESDTGWRASTARRRASSSRAAFACRCCSTRVRRTGSRCSTACGPSIARWRRMGLPAEVVVVEPTGADTQLFCRFNGQELTSPVRDRVSCRAGDRIGLVPDVARAHLFDAARSAARRMRSFRSKRQQDRFCITPRRRES